jgi:NAD(P)-dependent dehydrogenase (short-subunit alcohol dehydrogenase family)
MNSRPSVLITGANRGLGLELTRQYAADGWRVYACARRPAEAAELASIAAASEGRVTLHAVDLLDHGTIERLARELDTAAIDVLLNVAGTMGRADFARQGVGAMPFGATDYDDLLDTLRVNVLAPLKVVECFAPHVERGAQKKVVTLSSVVGSIASNTSGGLYAYRASKAAVNALMKSLAIDLGKRGIIALPMHPGWVRTDMGGPRAPLDAATSCAGIRRVIAGLTSADAGRFLQYDGQELPW